MNGLQEESRQLGLRLGPLGAGYSAAALAAAATGIAKIRLGRICHNRVVAMMGGFAHATCAWRSSSHRQHGREKAPDKREQQQQSGSQAVHLSRESEPHR
jgi:hypothetical protein